MKKIRFLILVLVFPMIVQGKTAMEWFEEVYFENDNEYYEVEEWVMVRDLINNKAPSLQAYLNLFANEGVKQSSFDEDNFSAIEELIDGYISYESDAQRQVLIAHAQNLGGCWMLARKLLDKKEDTGLKRELAEKVRIAAKSQVAYQLLTLSLEKAQRQEALAEVTEELEEIIKNIHQIENDQDAAIKELEASMLVDFTEISPLVIGGDAPDFTVNDLQTNKPLKLSELKGQVVYVDFWATWCGPCQEPMSHLNQVAKKHAEDWKGKVQLIGISLDDRSETALKHLQKNSWLDCRQTWPDNGFESIAAKKYHIRGIPTAFLIDRDGKIVWMGHPGEIELEDEIQSLLKGE